MLSCKVYDYTNWNFLAYIMARKGFGSKCNLGFMVLPFEVFLSPNQIIALAIGKVIPEDRKWLRYQYQVTMILVMHSSGLPKPQKDK